MAFSSDEKFIIDNQFGALTNRQVICFVNKNWFSRGSREYILLDKIISVRYKSDRNILLILFYLLVFTLLKLPIVGILLTILPLWGSPTITILTSNRKTRRLQGFPWEKKEAEAFADALCKQLMLIKDVSPKQKPYPLPKQSINLTPKLEPTPEANPTENIGIEPSTPQIKPEIPQPSSISPKHRLLLAAKENQGTLSLAQAALATNLEHEELKALLEECVEQGYADIITNPETGKLSYRFDV